MRAVRLTFTDGTALTSNRAAIIGYCQGAGYLVEPLAEAPTILQDALDGLPDTKSAGRSAARNRSRTDPLPRHRDHRQSADDQGYACAAHAQSRHAAHECTEQEQRR